ncbi:MAG TPA: SRPBCC family protein [Promineifilum sp.]|nr:SRPBCC family protein [Promineifilum sp.]
MTEQVSKTITVKRDVASVYNAWANFETFPYFMKYVETVEKLGPKMSHWEVKGPLGVNVDWNAETTRNDPNQRLGWNTKDHDGTVTTSGEVVFSELPDNQTKIVVTMTYTLPGGKLGEAVAQLFSDPEKRLEEDLRNFKLYIENGQHDMAAN